jgi:DNA-binding PadR family transcriptional regulator
MHHHDRHPMWIFFETSSSQRPHGRGCGGRQFGPREFGHRPGSPRFGDDGPRGFRGGPRGPRAKVGNLRLAVLALLAEAPANGYGMMGEISQRSGGVWQPSPGSMYPVLSQLEDEGLITATTQDGKKAYTLTEAGQQFVNENQDAVNASLQTGQEGGQGGRMELRAALHALMGAVQQVAQAGSEVQVKEAASVIGAARKSLYRLLAEDDAG